MAWDKSNVESEEIIAEASRRSYEIVRITRLKYKGNPHSFIDIRLFQRGYGDDDVDDEVFFPTKKGVQFREDLFQRLIGQWTLVPPLLFHKIVMERAWPSVTSGDYDTAVFQAFKALEIGVRKASGLSAELIGVDLMRKAFDPQNGPLAQQDLLPAEREAISHIFSGAIGLYKNPHSHRYVGLEFNAAFEMLLVASHLLNVLDRHAESEGLPKVSGST